jgi:tetratricopeptide (TPR) repeat protein/transcriptional regulator with XRE-family HTH domain
VALGVELRRARVRQGMSLRAAARGLGLGGHGSLVDFEHGRRLIPTDLLAGYARLFGADIGELERLRNDVLDARAEQVTAHGRTKSLAQLPAFVPDFVGREGALARLVSWLPGADAGPALVTISGPPGVGKTSLALRFADQVADGYPDGQLFVELRATGPARLLATMLVSLGVAEQDLPAGVDERSALFRSLVSGKRVLLVLDDATDEAQVRPLLPGRAPALVVVTARGPLAGLDGAHRLPLEVFSPAEALELLRRVAGSRRVDAEPVASSDVVARCAYLPLAVRVVAAGIAMWPAGGLRDWSEELADSTTRLGRLRAGDRSVAAVLETAYQALPGPAQLLFRRVPLMPGLDFTADTATVLIDAEAERTLAELCRRGLAQPAAPRRYRVHDLVRLFAEQRLAEEETPAARHALEVAVLTHLLGRAFDAGSTLDPSGYTKPGVDCRFADHRQAVRWLDGERRSLPPAVRRAAQLGLTDLVFPLADALPWYWDLRCHWDDWQEVNGIVLALAEQVGDVSRQVIALNGLALAVRTAGDAATAMRLAERALRLAKQAGLTDEEAEAHARLGWVLTDLGEHESAITHLKEAVRLHAWIGECWYEAAARSKLGAALEAAGRLVEAAASYQHAARLFGELGATRSEATACCDYADIQCDRGVLAEAEEKYRAALAVFTTYDDQWGVARARLGLGRVLAAEGEREHAKHELTVAMTGFAALHDDRYHRKAQDALHMLSG